MLSENVGILSLEEINNIFLMFFLMIPFSALGKIKRHLSQSTLRVSAKHLSVCQGAECSPFQAAETKRNENCLTTLSIK